MAKKQSAGILVFRRIREDVEVLLVHPGGPFWAKKDNGAWSLPKGEYTNEDPLLAAKREFKEETGTAAPEGDYFSLGAVEKPNKTIHAWAVEADFDERQINSNRFEMEWPPKSGQKQEFPEVDRAGWFRIADAPNKLNKPQDDFIRRLAEKLSLDIENRAEGLEQTSLF